MYNFICLFFIKIKIYFIIQPFFISTRCIHRLFKVQEIYFLPKILISFKIKVKINLLFLFFFWIFSINIIFLRFLHLLLAFHLIRGTRYYLGEIYCLFLIGIKIKLSWFLFWDINFAVSSVFIILKLKLILIFIIFTVLFPDLMIFIKWLRLIKLCKIKCFWFFWLDYLFSCSFNITPTRFIFILFFKFFWIFYILNFFAQNLLLYILNDLWFFFEFIFCYFIIINRIILIRIKIKSLNLILLTLIIVINYFFRNTRLFDYFIETPDIRLIKIK